MTEFFIKAHTFAAPFVSDTITEFVKAETAGKALANFVAKSSHPSGIYSAAAYESSDAMHKGHGPLAKWLSNQAAALSGPDVHTVMSNGPGDVEINGKRIKIKNPKAGSLVE